MPGSRLELDGLIVDLDGVVWTGGEAIPGSGDALAALQRHGIDVVFLTNDPSTSRSEHAARLTKLGVEATEAEVVTAGRAMASLVLEREGPSRHVFVVGSGALRREMRRVGLGLSDGEAGRDAGVVAVGAHPGFNYEELRIAATAVRNGAGFYAAGRDATFPMPDGPWPATGSILAAIETAADRRAVVAGKPETYIFRIAQSLLANRRRVAIVGDHLESDIVGGRRAGLITILVLTGTAAKEDIETADRQPDLVLPRLADILALV